MIFYTADLHIGHKNVINMSNRPFSSVDEMNISLVNNWNSVVSEEDEVYIIGDVLFNLKKHTDLYITQLKGKKHLIVGNHDIQNLDKEVFTSCFESINDYLCIDDEGRKVVLFHYPILEWNGYFRGYYHIYGHIHNNFDNFANYTMGQIKNAFNAGVDVNDFTPKTLNQLIEKNLTL